jgi:hypothetical protein
LVRSLFLPRRQIRCTKPKSCCHREQLLLQRPFNQAA